MHVLNTTSPFPAAAPSAPNSQPSKTAPDSSARRPRMRSATGRPDEVRRPGQVVLVVVSDEPIAQRQQDAATQPDALQRRIGRQRLAGRLTDDPLGSRVEEHAGRRLPDPAAEWVV